MKSIESRVAARHLAEKFDGVEWVEMNILDKKLLKAIDDYLRETVKGGKAIHTLVDQAVKKNMAEVQDGDKVRPDHVRQVVRKHLLNGPWGNDAMLQPLTRIIADGDFVF